MEHSDAGGALEGLVPIRTLKRMLLLSARPAYAGALRYRAGRAKGLEDLVELALNYRWRSMSIAPVQIREEICRLLEKVQMLDCRRILEIGTARGGTLFLFSRVARPDAALVSVDLRGGEYGGGYDPSQRLILKSFRRPRQRLTLIDGDSHSAGVRQRVRQAFGNGPIDFLFIDGDHEYQGVRADFRDYSPLVRPGGLIAFHDIVDGPAHRVGGVPRFWREVKEQFRHEEIVNRRDQGGLGIGVIYL